MTDDPIPMFPLGTVLLPSMILPLRVFEDRYREMIRDVMAGDQRFGVVMIERGSEVGGGDVRSSIGCVAKVVQAEELADGQWFVASVGTCRIRVTEWLPDDPYPRARCAGHSDGPAVPELADRVRALEPRFRTVLALAAELDEWSVPLTIELSEDPVMATYQMSAVSPFGTFDRQRLLAAPDAVARAGLVGELLEDAETVMRARLSDGAD